MIRNWRRKLTNCSKACSNARVPVLACLLLVPGQSFQAGEVLNAHVNHDGDHFLIHLDMLIDADPKRVYACLTDYAHLDRLSSEITTSELLYDNHPQYRVRVITNSCIGPFCQEVVQVQNVIERRNGYVLVRVMPEMSDLRYGQNLWHIRRENGRTRVTYSSDVVPDFWLPPVIGPLLFKQKLAAESRNVIETLEALARNQRRANAEQ